MLFYQKQDPSHQRNTHKMVKSKANDIINKNGILNIYKTHNIQTSESSKEGNLSEHISLPPLKNNHSLSHQGIQFPNNTSKYLVFNNHRENTETNFVINIQKSESRNFPTLLTHTVLPTQNQNQSYKKPHLMAKENNNAVTKKVEC